MNVFAIFFWINSWWPGRGQCVLRCVQDVTFCCGKSLALIYVCLRLVCVCCFSCSFLSGNWWKNLGKRYVLQLSQRYRSYIPHFVGGQKAPITQWAHIQVVNEINAAIMCQSWRVTPGCWSKTGKKSSWTFLAWCMSAKFLSVMSLFFEIWRNFKFMVWHSVTTCLEVNVPLSPDKFSSLTGCFIVWQFLMQRMTRIFVLDASRPDDVAFAQKTWGVCLDFFPRTCV